MSGLALVITSAGIAALANAQSTGVSDVLISQIGLANASFTAAATLTALPHEFKRLSTFGGEAVDDATIHISIRDDSADAYELFGFGLFLDDGTLFAAYSQGTRILGKASISVAMLAADIRLSAAVAGSIEFGSPSFMDPPATTERAGLVELATVPEALAGTDTVRAVTPAGLKAAVDAVIDGAPGALNTLKEISQSLANNPDLAGTMTNQLALKAPLASPALTGAPTATTPAGGDSSLRIATTAWAGADATGKANAAQTAAIGAAATDATGKANAAQAAAIGAAATDATGKANAAQAAAQGYADTKKAEAIAAAAADATAKDNVVRGDLVGYTDAAKANAIAVAAADATAKADAAQAAAIGTASADATGKANAAQAAAIAAVLAMFTGGNQSLASPGFQVFPGGFTVQWGEVSEMVTGDGLFSPVAFPQPFANTCFAVLPTSLNAGNNANADSLPNIVSHSAAGFNARSNTTSGVAFVTGFAWIAVGF